VETLHLLDASVPLQTQAYVSRRGFYMHLSGQLFGIVAFEPSTREYGFGYVCCPGDENNTSCSPHEKQRVM